MIVVKQTSGDIFQHRNYHIIGFLNLTEGILLKNI